MVHKLHALYNDGHAILSLDVKNAFNVPTRDDIAKAMFAFHTMKPFQRLFHTEYSESSELLFYGSSGNLHGMVNSTAGVRQGSSLSTLYFCTFFQPLLETMAHEFPELYIYACIDDVNFASKDPALISTAFQRFKVLLQEKRIELSCQKCVWFTGKNDIAMPDTLECQGTSTEAKADKFLGAFVGENQSVSSKLVQQLEKHDTIFRRLEAMGANNIRLFVKRGGCFQLRSHSCCALRVENYRRV